MPRAPWFLLLLAAALRALVCVRTEMPGRDGATYLWMAEHAADGDFAALFQTVFHPLYPAAVAALAWCLPWLDIMVAAQLVASGLAALAVVPLWFVAKHLAGARAAFWCGIGYATSTWSARHPAECLSEGPFYLCAAVWALALVGERRRPAVAGAAAALAYLGRPEGAALVVLGIGWLACRRAGKQAMWLASVAAPLMALLPIGFAVAGDGFTLTPKAAFNYEVGVGNEAHPTLHYLQHAARLPLAAVEQFGIAWLFLIVVGVVRWRPRGLLQPEALLLLPFVVQCVVVPLLHSHWRFLSGFGALLFVFAGATVPWLLDAMRRRHRRWPLLMIAVLVASEVRIVAARNADRDGERELGRWLRTQLAPAETFVSDMPRLYWLAGQKPPSPSAIEPGEVLAKAADPACRFVILIERPGAAGSAARRRTEVEPDQLRGLGLALVAKDDLHGLPLPGSVRLYRKARGR